MTFQRKLTHPINSFVLGEENIPIKEITAHDHASGDKTIYLPITDNTVQRSVFTDEIVSNEIYMNNAINEINFFINNGFDVIATFEREPPKNFLGHRSKPKRKTSKFPYVNVRKMI